MGPVVIATTLIVTTVLVSWGFPPDFEAKVAAWGRFWAGLAYLILFQLTGFVLLGFGVFRCLVCSLLM